MAQTSKKHKLVPLQYRKHVYCELCGRRLRPGELVGWWRIRGYGGRLRWAVYCRECHSANVRAGKGLR
jgi:RNase P subunit RPR2